MSNDKNPQTHPLERGIPDLKKREKKKGSMNKVFWLAGIMVALIIILFLAMIFIKRLQEQKAADGEGGKPKDTAEASQRKNFGKDIDEIKARELQARLDKEAAKQPAMIPPKDGAQPIPLQTAQAPAPGQPQGAPPKPPPPNPKFLGSVIVNKASSPAAQPAQGQQTQQPGQRPGQPVTPGASPWITGDAGAAGNNTGGAGGAKLDERLSPSVLAGTSASLRSDLSMLLRRGTMIPCVQASLIVTNHPSLILCKTTKDIYSANGKVLLVERGSTVIGEQRTGLQRGQKTIYAIWTRIETDKGVSIDVNSPASNALGAAGIDAYIDDHWWERFGNAILLSVIGDTLEGVKNYFSQRGNSNTFYPSQSQDTTQNMATEALKNSINIPPTGYSNQGSLLNIFVARDVDFRKVYHLIAARPSDE